jgi:hypothetical protein
VLRRYRRTLAGDRRHLLERFRYAHAARKVVGVGSVGTRTFIVLMVGHDTSDPLFLQIKQAEASVLEPLLGKSHYANHGQRMVEGQRLMEAASDVMLGWDRIPDPNTGIERGCYIRQLWEQPPRGPSPGLQTPEGASARPRAHARAPRDPTPVSRCDADGRTAPQVPTLATETAPAPQRDRAY